MSYDWNSGARLGSAVSAPRGWDTAWRAALARAGQQIVPVMLIGDSLARGANSKSRAGQSFWLRFIASLIARYGSAGSGLHYVADTGDTTGNAGTSLNPGGATADMPFSCWHFATTGTDWSTGVSAGIGGLTLTSDNAGACTATGIVDAGDTAIEIVYTKYGGGGQFTTVIDGQAYDKNGLAGGGGGNLNGNAGTAVWAVPARFPGSGTLPNSGAFLGTSTTAIGTGAGVAFTLASSSGSPAAMQAGSNLLFDGGTGQQEVVTVTTWNPATRSGTATFANNHAAGTTVQAVHVVTLQSVGTCPLVGAIGYNGQNGILPMRIARSAKSLSDFTVNNYLGAGDPVLSHFANWTIPPKLCIMAHGINDMGQAIAFDSYERYLERWGEAALTNGCSMLYMIPWLGASSAWTNQNLAGFYIDRVNAVAQRLGAAVLNINTAWEAIIAADPAITPDGPPYHGGYQILGQSNSTDLAPFTYTTSGGSSHPTNAGHADIASRLIALAG